jgi:hypothetical protein
VSYAERVFNVAGCILAPGVEFGRAVTLARAIVDLMIDLKRIQSERAQIESERVESEQE